MLAIQPQLLLENKLSHEIIIKSFNFLENLYKHCTVHMSHIVIYSDLHISR